MQPIPLGFHSQHQWGNPERREKRPFSVGKQQAANTTTSICGETISGEESGASSQDNLSKQHAKPSPHSNCAILNHIQGCCYFHQSLRLLLKGQAFFFFKNPLSIKDNKQRANSKRRQRKDSEVGSCKDCNGSRMKSHHEFSLRGGGGGEWR